MYVALREAGLGLYATETGRAQATALAYGRALSPDERVYA